MLPRFHLLGACKADNLSTVIKLTLMPVVTPHRELSGY